MQCPKQQERRKAAAEAKAAKAEAAADAESNGSKEGGERVSKTTQKRATSKA
jgi:hypothetical protein